jgi:hypothetical protein
MPFTISHAAAVLPFSRALGRWRVLSALVIGSMIPDFGYFMPYRLPRVETHSAASLLTFSLPLGLAFYWVFQRWIKKPMREVLPDGAYLASQSHAPIADIASPRQWAIAAAGVLIGAITHLIWDGFTHEGARGVRMLPEIDEWVVDVGGHALAGPRFLEDFSSLLGLVLVGWFIWRFLRTRAPADRPARRLPPAQRVFWCAAYLCTAIVVTAADILRIRWFYPRAIGIGPNLGIVAIAGLRGVGVAVLTVSLCLALRLRQDP